jgi:hypothetical protein
MSNGVERRQERGSRKDPSGLSVLHCPSCESALGFFTPVDADLLDAVDWSSDDIDSSMEETDEYDDGEDFGENMVNSLIRQTANIGEYLERIRKEKKASFDANDDERGDLMRSTDAQSLLQTWRTTRSSAWNGQEIKAQQ